MSAKSAVSKVLTFMGKVLERLRLYIANTLVILLMLILVSALFGGISTAVQSDDEVPEQAILQIDLDSPVQEAATISEPDITDLISGDVPFPLSLRDITDALETAATDDRITAVALDLNQYPGGNPAILTAIGQPIEQFRETSGKPVLVGSNYMSQSQYYLASFADQIYMNPMGAVILGGLSMDRLYFAEALEKLKVNVHIFRVGKFKSAVEPFTRDDMSTEARQANQELLDDLWAMWRAQVASNPQHRGR